MVPKLSSTIHLLNRADLLGGYRSAFRDRDLPATGSGRNHSAGDGDPARPPDHDHRLANALSLPRRALWGRRAELVTSSGVLAAAGAVAR